MRVRAEHLIHILLCRTKNGLRFGEIMKMLGYSKGSVSIALRKLITEGYVVYENGRYRAVKCPDIFEIITRGGDK